MLAILPNFVHHNIWVCRSGTDTILAFLQHTELNPRLITSLHFNSRPIHLLNGAPKNLRFGIHSLKVEPNQWAIVEIRILDHNTIFSLWNNVHGALLELWESAIWYLYVWIYCDGTGGVIGLVSDEIATNQVDCWRWEGYQGHELLVESVRDWFKRKCALTEDDTTWVDTDDAVHIPSNVEFGQWFDAGALSILDILLGFLELFCQLNTRMSKDDSLKVDKLAFLKLDIDYWTCITDDDDLGVFVSLFNG